MKNEETKKPGFRKYFVRTFIIGLGLFSLSLMDPLYNTYVPLYLRRYIGANFLVGGIMTLDNILQLLLIPVVAIWSDRTRTRIGRRMPFIAVMLPVSALLFHLIPLMAVVSLWALIAIIFFFNIFKTSVRGPVVALMPDTIPGEYRSEANGVISMMGGIGVIIGTLVLTRLSVIRDGMPFTAAGICTILAVVVLLLFVREKLPDSTPEKTEEKKRFSIMASIRQVFFPGEGTARDYSAPLILISLFFWFMAYEGLQPFLGLYLVEVIGVAESNAALAQGVAGISGVALAIPSGYAAHRLGRRRFIRICLVFLTIILLAVPFSTGFALRQGLSLNACLLIFLLLMFLYGTVWIGVMVNSFPMIWQMTNYDNVGVYTGLYYTFSQSAAIFAPPITGLIIDLGGYRGIFIFSGLCMFAAWCTMGGVKAGEPED
ncbi:MAG: MFS transporter [Spirochaetaceae bacterium]|jgi:MFS family permease|nr:MFS transporter [Spirochaetaceae bacterium]